MKESAIEKEIRLYAESRGCLFKKFTSPGWVKVPDRIILLPDWCAVKVAFMEVKKPGGDIHPKQIRVCNELQARGIPSCIIDNVESGKGFIDAILNA